jgi:hypothetical protein
MGACELESSDVALAAIPIKKMTISIAQILPLIIDWRIWHAKEDDRPPTGTEDGQRWGRSYRYRIKDAHGCG